MPWKTAQKKSKQKRTVRLALLTLGLILGLILVSQILKVSHILLSPLNQEKRTYHWDTTFNLNLVLQTKPMSLLSYNPVEQTIKIIEIPDETYLEVPGGFGSWRAGIIDRLGGAQLVKDAIGNYFALPIDGFLGISGKDMSGSNMVDLFRGNPLTLISTLSNLKTDLTPVELARFYWGMRGVRFDKIETYNLSDLGLLSEGTLADGTKILIGDPTKIDGMIAKNFTDSKIIDEGAAIAVFNATDKPGLAGKSASLISHIGGNVIIQTSLEENSSQTAVFGKKNPYTLRRLKEIFQSTCEGEKDCAILGASASSAEYFSRAQVNLILGSE